MDAPKRVLDTQEGSWGGLEGANPPLRLQNQLWRVQILPWRLQNPLLEGQEWILELPGRILECPGEDLDPPGVDFGVSRGGFRPAGAVQEHSEAKHAEV